VLDTALRIRDSSSVRFSLRGWALAPWGKEGHVKQYEAPVVIATYKAAELRIEATQVAVASA
jgi:hypothetical protein